MFGGVLVKVKQWAFGLHPIHLSRSLSRVPRGEPQRKGKNNGKPGDPSIDHHSRIHRMLAKILIPSLIRAGIYRALCFFNDRSLLFDQIMYLDNEKKWCVI